MDALAEADLKGVLVHHQEPGLGAAGWSAGPLSGMAESMRTLVDRLQKRLLDRKPVPKKARKGVGLRAWRRASSWTSHY